MHLLFHYFLMQSISPHSLYYSISGTGQPIILLHGLFGNSSNLTALAKYLSETHQVINVDLRNHGLSPHFSEHDYALMAQDVVSLYELLNIPQADVFGHSMGGKVAMQIALRYPEKVSRLIIEDIAPVHYGERHQDIFNGLHSVNLAYLLTRGAADKQLSVHIETPSIRQFLLKSLIKNETNQWVWQFNLAVLYKHYADVCQFPSVENQFTGKTLFIKGGQSHYILRDHQADIVHYFPNAKAKIIQAAGHWAHAEKSTIFNKIVGAFLLN